MRGDDTPQRMRSTWIPAALAALALVVLTGWAATGALGCSTSSGGCGSLHCDTGNMCIDDGTGPACHKVCTVQSDCPTDKNWYCNDGNASSAGVSWCVPNTTAYTMKPGQWNARCSASKGEGANPDCDWSQQFACFASNPLDGDAYCTQFACTSDADCTGGFWCATVNVGPNATSATPTFGKTRNVCVRRSYCAPCKKDLDCLAGSTPMHCVPDTNGATFCAPQCGSDSNCVATGQYDSTCTTPWKVCSPAASTGSACKTDDECPPSGGTYQHCVGGACSPECNTATDCSLGSQCVANVKVCVPRAGVCVGDGSFCSPCRSDDDCAPKATGTVAMPRAPGFCLTGADFQESYTTEHFCSTPATVPDCDAMAADPAGCPQPMSGTNWRVTACTESPPNQCIGVVTFGASAGSTIGIPGCWTVNR